MENRTDREIKICCSTFYQSDVVRVLLGDVLHPGGLALTRQLGEVLALGPGERVLDVACGRGASAVHLAEQLGCHVIGLDYGADTIAAAKAAATESAATSLTSFRQGDAEDLPFDTGAFDAVISECSFCTFPQKGVAAREMARVLAPRGRLGLTDITVDGPVPNDIQTLLSWVACIAGAGTAADYVATLRGAGFADFVVEDHSDALLDMVTDVRRRLLGVELAAGLGRLDLADLDLDEVKRLARRVVELIDGGRVGYVLIAARKV